MKEGYVETGKRKKERERASGEEKGCHGKSGKKKKVQGEDGGKGRAEREIKKDVMREEKRRSGDLEGGGVHGRAEGGEAT